MSDETTAKTELTGTGAVGDDPAETLGWLSRIKSRLGFNESPTVRDLLVEALKADGTSAQAFAPLERQMLQRILRFGQLRVEDVMVPRADIVAIEESASLADLLEVFRQAGHSRIPVYHETLDDLHGMIHIKDLVRWLVEQTEAPKAAAEGDAQARLTTLDLSKLDLSAPLGTARIRRSLLFVPPSMPALNLFLRMQSTRNHLALVVDEYGGTDGLVSIENLVEQVVGEIEDEHDDAIASTISEPAPGVLIASGRTPIADLERQLGVMLADEEETEDFDTLGGMIVAMIGRVPLRGEIVHHRAGLEFEVLEADPRRIKKLKVHRRPQSAGNGADAGALSAMDD